MSNSLSYSARARLADVGSLVKIRQTALLWFTGVCGYVITRGLPLDLHQLASLTIGLLCSIGGCTVLNMVLDRDIDAHMGRTVGRPLPSGRILPLYAAAMGGGLSLVGLGSALLLDRRFGTVVLSGYALNLLLYTAWLKRRTALAALFGGIAGGMPILAGRVLALGRVDLAGLLLAAAILLWIPCHNLTLALHHAREYDQAGVPVWPNRYGTRSTYLLIAIANLLQAIILAAAALLLHANGIVLALLAAMGLAMVGLSARQIVAPTAPRNWFLFKAASAYMVAAPFLLAVGQMLGGNTR